MERNDQPGLAPPQLIDREIDPVRIGVQQVHPTDNHIRRFRSGQAFDMLQGVHDAGMPASQNDEPVRFRLDEQRLVVRKRVGCPARGIRAEIPTCVLNIVISRDFTRHIDAIENLRRGAGPLDAAPAQALFCGCGHAVISHGPAVAAVLVFNCRRVQVYLRLRCVFQHLRQSAGVVIVAVAQHDSIRFGKVDAEQLGIPDQQRALAGIEQDAPAAVFNPQGETVLALESLAVPLAVDLDMWHMAWRDAGYMVPLSGRFTVVIVVEPAAFAA